MRTLTITTVFVMAFATMSVAGELPKGTVELSTTGSFSHQSMSMDGTDAGSTTNMNLEGEVGYSLTRNLSLAGGLVFQHAGISDEAGESASASAYGPQVGARWNFATNSSIVPWVEGMFGVLAYGGDAGEGAETTLLLPSVGGGVRWLLGETASVNFSGNFVRQQNAAGVDQLNSNDIRFGVGLSVFPGGLATQ